MTDRRRPPGVFVEEIPSGPRPILARPTSVTAFVGGATSGPVDQAVLVGSLAEFVETFGDAGSPLGYAVRAFLGNGGREAVIVRVGGAAVEDYLSADDAGRGVGALSEIDPVNLLVLVPAKHGAEVPVPAWSAVLDWAVAHRAMLFVDPPGDVPPAEVSTWLVETAGIRGSAARNAAVYVPRFDDGGFDDGGRQVAPSAAVAGVYVRTDDTRGVWKAPAGSQATITGVADLTIEVPEEVNSVVGPLGVNVIRRFPGRPAPVVW